MDARRHTAGIAVCLALCGASAAALAELRAAYAALPGYQDRTECRFFSGVPGGDLVENDARFSMQYSRGGRFALRDLMGVDLYGDGRSLVAYQTHAKRYRRAAADQPWRDLHPVLGFSDVVYPVLGLLLDPDAGPLNDALRWTVDPASGLLNGYSFDFRPTTPAGSAARLLAGDCRIVVTATTDTEPAAFAAAPGDVEVGDFAEVRRAQSGMVGRAAPDVVADRLDGGSFRLDDLAGKVVVLDFWATWCPNCALSWSRLREVEAAFAERPDVAFFGVNLDSSDRAAITAYLERHRIHTPQLVDPERRIAASYRILGTPAIVVIDTRGRVAAVRAGQWADMVDDLVRLIDGASN